jgi:pyruvate dehydrogenase E2 component (dihydrolipoamide acetyltransferase)
MEEGTITKWLKNEGDSVEKGEPLVEVMTDKANMEVESPASGLLRKIIAEEGSVVPVKDLIAVIGSADEPIDGLLPTEASAPAASASAAATAAPVPISATQVGPVAESAEGRLFASPRAKKLAAEHGIDINLLAGKGTGPEGRIVEQDVLAFSMTVEPIATAKATSLAGKIASDMGLDIASVPGSGPRGKVTRDDVLSVATRKVSRPSIGRSIPLAGMRKIIADNISRSIRTAPHVTLISEVDMTACSTMREQLLPEFEKRYGVRLTVTGIIVKAAAMAILDHPIINSSLLEDSIVIHDEVNIGVAAAVDGGLVVPVIRDADKKPLYQIAEELSALAAKARAGSLALDEMQGGTFTISNLASCGVDSFNPIINPPESAILGVCRSAQKPVVVNGQVTIRLMMNLCLSFDHRVMDGAPAGAYLSRVKELLEQPYLLLV